MNTKIQIIFKNRFLLNWHIQKNNLCVVGDEDQAIYRFRAATVRNILEFPVVFVGSLNKNFLVQKEEDRYLLPFSKRGAFETEEQMNQFVQIRHYYVAFSRAQNLLVLKTSGNPNDWFEPNFSLVSLMNQSFRSNTHFPKKTFSISDINVYENCRQQFLFYREFNFEPLCSSLFFCRISKKYDRWYPSCNSNKKAIWRSRYCRLVRCELWVSNQKRFKKNLQSG